MRRGFQRLTMALISTLLWVNPSPASAHRVRAVSNGGSVLAVLTTFRGEIPSSAVLAVHEGRIRVLLHRSGVAFDSITPSPDGRSVAALGCCRPGVAGIWVVHRDGTHLRRVVRLPPSPCSNPLAAGSIVWSPGGHRLAYIIYITSDAIRGCPSGVHDVTGVWVTPYDHPKPRQIEVDSYAVSSPPLSWSPDGRTLAVSSRGSVRALDVTTGVSRPLVRGAYAGIYAPMTGALAYVTSGSGSDHATRIWLAGAQGYHRHILVSTTLGLAESPLVWSLDGRSVAYITDTGSVYRRGARTLAVPGTVALHPRTLVVAQGGALDSPSWSPDGRHIAYSGAASCSCRGTSPPGASTTIFTVDVATGARRVLVTPRQLLAVQRSPVRVTSVTWVVR